MKKEIPITTSVSSGLGTTGGTAKGCETAVSDFLAEQMEKGE